MKPSSRRNFISNAAKAGIISMISIPSLETASAFGKDLFISHPLQTGFDQEPLPYAYDALEPFIDKLTMDIHYNKHAGAYSKNLKEAAAAEKVDMNKPLEDVLSSISKYSVKMRNNAGGHYNHGLFWKCLSANTATQPSGKLLTAIEKDFGSLDQFKKQFTDIAKSRFGSGWAWLVCNSDKKLLITSTPNQDNTLMDIAETKGFPLFGLDVWEHAYYLKYQNRRADYIDAFWKILNWNYVQERFAGI